MNEFLETRISSTVYEYIKQQPDAPQSVDDCLELVQRWIDSKQRSAATGKGRVNAASASSWEQTIPGAEEQGASEHEEHTRGVMAMLTEEKERRGLGGEPQTHRDSA